MDPGIGPMKKLVLGVVGVLVLAALALFLLRSSDEKVIEALLQEGAAAAQRGDADAVMALVSKDYRNGDEDYAKIEAKIRRVVGQRTGMLEVGGVAVSVSGDVADASCVVRVMVLSKELGRFGLRTKFKREAGKWKVVEGEETRQ
jgi:ketosteroid isomerase-like protein